MWIYGNGGHPGFLDFSRDKVSVLGLNLQVWQFVLDGHEENTDQSESRSLSREGPSNVLWFRIILSSSMCWSYCCMWMLGVQKPLWDGRNWLWSSLIVKLVAIVVEIKKRDFMVSFGKCVFLKVPLKQLLGNTFIVFSEFLGPLVKPTIWFWCLFKL